MGAGGHVLLGQKLLNAQGVWADVLINQPSQNGQTQEKSFQRNSLKPNRWLPLEALTELEKPVLRGAHAAEDKSVFWGVPPCVCVPLHMYAILYI